MQTTPTDGNNELGQQIIRSVERGLLPQLQSGEETYLLLADKKLRVKQLPPLPGASPHLNSTQTPIIHNVDKSQKRWRKDAILGFVYIIRGSEELMLNNHVVTCHAGNIIFFLPHTYSDRGSIAHWQQKTSASDCDLLWIYLRQQEVVCHLTGQCAVGKEIRFVFIPDNRAQGLAEQVHEELCLDAISPAATQLIWIIFDRIRHRLRQGNFLTSRLSLQEMQGNKRASNESIGQRAQTYIDANVMERMTLESVANAVFTSRSQLAREFRRHTGETFNGYLLRRRLERAQHLLSTTSLSIKEIAWRAGFADPNYFSVVFQRTFGNTPSEFRKNETITKK